MLYDDLQDTDEQINDPSVEELLTYLKSLLQKKFKYVLMIGGASLFIVYLVSGGSGAETSVVVSEESETQIGGELSGEQDVFVDLAGAVAKPGVYKLPYGSRVADLVSAGGPVSSDASVSWISQNLNLSEVLMDTQKVYIPFEWELADEGGLTVEMAAWRGNESGSANKAGNEGLSKSDDKSVSDDDMRSNTQDENGSSKINVNSASQTELESLNGIGKVYSQRIIDNRPYIDAEELKVKANIPDSTIGKIENFITF